MPVILPLMIAQSHYMYASILIVHGNLPSADMTAVDFKLGGLIIDFITVNKIKC